MHILQFIISQCAATPFEANKMCTDEKSPVHILHTLYILRGALCSLISISFVRRVLPIGQRGRPKKYQCRLRQSGRCSRDNTL